MEKNYLPELPILKIEQDLSEMLKILCLIVSLSAKNALSAEEADLRIKLAQLKQKGLKLAEPYIQLKEYSQSENKLINRFLCRLYENINVLMKSMSSQNKQNYIQLSLTRILSCRKINNLYTMLVELLELAEGEKKASSLSINGVESPKKYDSSQNNSLAFLHPKAQAEGQLPIANNEISGRLTSNGKTSNKTMISLNFKRRLNTNKMGTTEQTQNVRVAKNSTVESVCSININNEEPGPGYRKNYHELIDCISDLDEGELRKRFIRAQDDIRRNSKYQYIETLERNKNMLGFISQYTTNFKKYEDKVIYRLNKVRNVLNNGNSEHTDKQFSLYQNYVCSEVNNWKKRKQEPKQTKDSSKDIVLRNTKTNIESSNAEPNGIEKTLIYHYDNKKKEKSSSLSYLGEQKEIRGRQLLQRIASKVSETNSSLLRVSKINFIEREESGQCKFNMISEATDFNPSLEKTNIKNEVQFSKKPNKGEAVSNKIRFSQLRSLKSNSFFPSVAPSFLMACRSYHS